MSRRRASVDVPRATPAVQTSGREKQTLIPVTSKLVVARRTNDRFGTLRRLVVYVDNSKVARLRRGEECALEAEAGDHLIQVRMTGFGSFPVWVRIGTDHPTRVSFGIEDATRELKDGLVG